MNQDDLHKDLKALGKGKTEYHFDGPHPTLLEAFPNPMVIEGVKLENYQSVITIRAPEFTSLCPKTGQPDFATIHVEYEPRDFCVESKSFKLYLNSFRNVGSFHEQIVGQIAADLIGLLDPRAVLVRGEFTPRGGIPFWPVFRYRSPNQK